MNAIVRDLDTSEFGLLLKSENPRTKSPIRDQEFHECQSLWNQICEGICIDVDIVCWICNSIGSGNIWVIWNSCIFQRLVSWSNICDIYRCKILRPFFHFRPGFSVTVTQLEDVFITFNVTFMLQAIGYSEMANTEMSILFVGCKNSAEILQQL